MISVFTPVDKRTRPFLPKAAASLEAQTWQNFEWIIGHNGGSSIQDGGEFERYVQIQIPDEPFQEFDGAPNAIGRLKACCCAAASGDILVELDADDLLAPNALERIHEAFEDPGVHFVYSNFAQFTDTWESPVFSTYYGWRHRKVELEGHPLKEQVAFAPTVHSIRRVEWAPNHARAWRTSSYKALGGHNPRVVLGDDHELLCRTYVAHGEAGFKHLDECLYFYRVGNNTSQTRLDQVQTQIAKNYVAYIYPMVLRWAMDHGLHCYDLGGGINPHPGFVSVDLEDAQLTADLNKPWPFRDDSVGALRANHLIEHLDDVVHFFREAFRVLAPGGWLLLEYPSADGKLSFRDPTHKHHMNQDTLRHFTQADFAKFVRFKGRFQASRICSYDWAPQCPVVAAELIAVKGDYARRPVGEVLM